MKWAIYKKKNRNPFILFPLRLIFILLIHTERFVHPQLFYMILLMNSSGLDCFRINVFTACPNFKSRPCAKSSIRMQKC